MQHIDCAEIYRNEHEVGEALEAVITSGVVKREVRDKGGESVMANGVRVWGRAVPHGWQRLQCMPTASACMHDEHACSGRCWGRQCSLDEPPAAHLRPLLAQELWVTSKVWNSNHGQAGVERAVRRSLKNLRLTYLDLYLIHWPAAENRGPSVQPPIQVGAGVELAAASNP
jgi:hypothetical protein